jgi:hypothetical protein
MFRDVCTQEAGWENINIDLLALNANITLKPLELECNKIIRQLNDLHETFEKNNNPKAYLIPQQLAPKKPLLSNPSKASSHANNKSQQNNKPPAGKGQISSSSSSAYSNVGTLFNNTAKSNKELLAGANDHSAYLLVINSTKKKGARLPS